MIAALGHSEDLDSADAIAEALDQCAETLAGKTPQAGLLYAGIDHDHQALLDGIEARYPGIQLIGCTTHGEMSSGGFAEDSVVLMLFHSDRVQFRAGIGLNARTNPDVAGQAIAMALDGLDAPVRLCVAFPDGVVSEGMVGIIRDGIIGALGEALGPDVPVCGGMAGDQIRFSRTYQFFNGAVHSESMPVLLFAGPLDVAVGVASGWEPVGEDHRLTDMDGLVIAGIDGERPRDFWMRYFGSADLSGTRNYFAVYPDAGGGSEEFYLCGPSHFQENGSMVTMNPAVGGTRIRFADGTRDGVLNGATSSAARARKGYPVATPEAALVFSCAARHMVLGTWVVQEVDRFQEQIGVDVPAIGFYTYGEICPLPSSPTPVHHVCTFVTVLIGEGA